MATVLAISGSLLAVSGCIIVSDDDAADGILTVDNNSDFFIDEIYVAPVGTTDYGPNLAPGGGLGPDDIIDIEVECDDYDVLLVDEEGFECEVFDVDLCLRDALIEYRNNSCSILNATESGDGAKKGDAAPAAPKKAPQAAPAAGTTLL